MNESQRKTRAEYERKGFAQRSGYGVRPALLVVDFINGFTDPQSPLGGNFSAELDVTKALLDGFRSAALPVVFTTTAYAEPDFSDGGAFVKKVPALKMLTRGSVATEVDPRIKPNSDEHIVEKKFASAFFATALDEFYRRHDVDTVVITGCTTSGCVRASAIDAMQHGFVTVVVRDAVGDRAKGPHEANLFDIDAKYGDVVDAHAVFNHLRDTADNGGFAKSANNDFLRWWQNRPALAGGT